MAITQAQKNRVKAVAIQLKKQNPYYNLTQLRNLVHQHYQLKTNTTMTRQNIVNTLTNIWYHNTNF
jgi:hypothetical protein